MYLNRLQTYVSMVNFMMILYLYITESPVGIEWYWWVLLLMGIFPLVVIIDIKLIYPGMLQYAFKKNPGMKRLDEKIDIIMKHLGLEYKKKR